MRKSALKEHLEEQVESKSRTQGQRLEAAAGEEWEQ
jgi:hypothetical protein